MKARALKPFSGRFGRFKRGQDFDAPDHYVEEMVKRGLAAPLTGKEAAKDGTANPSKRPTGGQRGKAKQSPSSQADQASKASPSKNSEGAAE
jgi:hypothetical protein